MDTNVYIYIYISLQVRPAVPGHPVLRPRLPASPSLHLPDPDHVPGAGGRQVPLLGQVNSLQGLQATLQTLCRYWHRIQVRVFFLNNCCNLWQFVCYRSLIFNFIDNVKPQPDPKGNTRTCLLSVLRWLCSSWFQETWRNIESVFIKHDEQSHYLNSLSVCNYQYYGQY